MTISERKGCCDYQIRPSLFTGTLLEFKPALVQ